MKAALPFCMPRMSSQEPIHLTDHAGLQQRSTFAVCVVTACILAILSAAGIPLHAQTASFTGTTVQLASSFGFSQPQGVALDSLGNLYIADSGNNAIEEMKLVNGVYQTPVALPAPSGGYNFPIGVAAAANGDVFVADTRNNAVQWIPSGCSTSSCVTEIAHGSFNHPDGLTVDASGNIFVANTALNQVDEILKTGGYVTVSLVAAGFNSPVGVATDASDNVFVADYGDSAVYETALVGGVYQPSHAVGNGFNKPNGVAIDSGGNLYIADTHNSAIKEIAAADISSSSPAINTVASGLSLPVGVVIDPSGNIFVGDDSGGTSGLGGVYEIMRSAVNFGALAVGSTSATASLQFSFTETSNTFIGTPFVVTQGAAGRDFADAGTGTCTITNGASNPYAPGSTCTIDIKFSPTQSGVTSGAAELIDTSGNLLATVYLYGSGIGPQIVFSSTAQVPQGSGFKSPAGLAVDKAGTLYVADSGNNVVTKINGATTSSLGSGLSDPQGVAVDGAGNVFVADTGNNAIQEIVAATGTIRVLGGSFSFSGPAGVAVDHTGNVYVANTGTGSIDEITAASGYSAVVPLSSGFSAPASIAVDGSGDVFVVDASSTPVRELVAVDGQVGSSPAVQTVGSAWTTPSAVTVDANGNLYVADSGDGRVVEIPLSGAGFGTPIVLASNLTSPAGIAVDGMGNVDYSSSAANSVTELTLATPPTLNFAPTTVGQTSSDSPKSVTVTNLGNASLSVSNLTYSTDFPEDGATTCTSTINLAQNSACQISVDFTPTTTSVPTEDVTLTNNNLNVLGATQQIPLTGTVGNLGITQPSGAALPGGTVGLAYGPVTFQASGGSGTGYTWTATTLPAGLTLDSASGVLSGTPTAAVSSFSLTVTATDSGTGSSGLQVSRVYQITIAPGTITLNWNPPSSITYGADLSSVLTATESVGSTIEPSSFGTSAYSASLNPGGPANAVTSATVLAAGTYTLTLTYIPSDTTDYNSPAPIQVTLTVTRATTTVSAWPTASAITFGQTLSSSTLSGGAASVGGTFAFTNPATAPPAGTSAQSVTFTPTDTADYNTVTGTVTVTVNKATPTVSTWPTAGAITFGQTLASSTLSGGSASVGGTFAFTNPATAPPAGTSAQSVTFTPTDSTDYNTVTGTVNVTVNKASVTISWAPPSSIPYGTNLNGLLDATATAGTQNVAGAFSYTAQASGSSAVPVSGSTVLSAGSYTLSAVFTPTDTTDFNGNSRSVVLQVTLGTLTVVANNATRVYGTANPTFTGTITGAVNGDNFTESFSTTAAVTSSVGTYLIVPSASGADLSDYTVTVGNGTLTITKAPTTTTLTISSSAINQGSAVTLTAAVVSGTTGSPTGSVSFYNGATLLGAATLSGGTASYTSSSIAPGSQSLTAVYSGDANFLTSTSTAIPITVEPLNFSISASPGSQSGKMGQSFTYAITLTPTSGAYPGTVQFSASGLPAEASASFSPSSLAANAGPQTVTMTISTGAAVASSHPLPARGRAPLALALLLLPLAGFRRMRRHGQRLSNLLCLLLLAMGAIVATTSLTSCGYNSGLTNYSVTVSATSAGVQQSTTVGLTLR